MNYSADAQSRCAEHLVGQLLEELSPVADRPQRNDLDQMLATAAALILRPFCAICKSAAFEEERECRLIITAAQTPNLEPDAKAQLTTPR